MSAIEPGVIVNWGRSRNRYMVWVVRGDMARIADLYGNRNFGVALDRLRVAEDQSIPEGAKRVTAPSADTPRVRSASRHEWFVKSLHALWEVTPEDKRPELQTTFSTMVAYHEGRAAMYRGTL